MQYAFYDRSAEHKPVPESIEFGTHCVVVPKLESAYTLKTLAGLAVVQPKSEIGSWIERGDPLAEALLPVFDRRYPPSKWAFWVEDSFTYLRYKLLSPVSGLVIGMRAQRSAYHGMASATDSGRSLCYGDNEVRSVLLIPRDEPPPTDWSYEYFISLGRSIRVNYPQLLHSSKNGYQRMPKTVAEFFNDREQAKIDEFLISDPPSSVPPVRITTLEKLAGGTRFIEAMRAHDYTLRRKLAHIGGMAGDMAE